MNRRIRAIETLRRLEERELDLLSRELCAVRDAKIEAEARITELDRRASIEASSSLPEALPYIGRFLATLRREQSREAARAQQLSGEIETLRDQVMVRFSSEKTYSSLNDRLREVIREARLNKEEAMIEDITSARFRRDA